MTKYLSQVPQDVQELILDLAASNGLNKNDYNDNELIGFVEGAVAMYFFKQKQVVLMEVEIDLLESEL